MVHAFDAADSKTISDALRNQRPLAHSGLPTMDPSNARAELLNPLTTISQHHHPFSLGRQSCVSGRPHHLHQLALTCTLRKQDGRWYLLYNVLHRPQFVVYYRAALQRAAEHVSWGQTRSKVRAMSLRQLFRMYATLTVETDYGKRAYDPTVNLFLNPEQCWESSVLRENRW